MKKFENNEDNINFCKNYNAIDLYSYIENSNFIIINNNSNNECLFKVFSIIDDNSETNYRK